MADITILNDMQEFVFTSKKFSGSMRFGYIDGVLQLYENNAQLTEEQLTFFEHNFPFRMENLEKIRGNTGKFTEVTDASFQAFWDKYGYKVDKINAEKYYNKMTKGDRVAAICGVDRYKTRCKMNNTAMIYPVRYLRYRRWEDET